MAIVKTAVAIFLMVVCKRLEIDDAAALSDWLRTRKQEGTAFLLAIDQFEELFTFAQRRRFDRLLSGDARGSRLSIVVISTVLADFLDRFGDDVGLRKACCGF